MLMVVVVVVYVICSSGVRMMYDLEGAPVVVCLISV